MEPLRFSAVINLDSGRIAAICDTSTGVAFRHLGGIYPAGQVACEGAYVHREGHDLIRDQHSRIIRLVKLTEMAPVLRAFRAQVKASGAVHPGYENYGSWYQVMED